MENIDIKLTIKIENNVKPHVCATFSGVRQQPAPGGVWRLPGPGGERHGAHPRTRGQRWAQTAARTHGVNAFNHDAWKSMRLDACHERSHVMNIDVNAFMQWCMAVNAFIQVNAFMRRCMKHTSCLYLCSHVGNECVHVMTHRCKYIHASTHGLTTFMRSSVYSLHCVPHLCICYSLCSTVESIVTNMFADCS